MHRRQIEFKFNVIQLIITFALFLLKIMQQGQHYDLVLCFLVSILNALNFAESHH